MTAVPTKEWLDVTLDLATHAQTADKPARAKLYWVQFKCTLCSKTKMHRVMSSKFDTWIRTDKPSQAWPTMPEHVREITSGICSTCERFGPKMHYLIITGSRTFPNANDAGEAFFRLMVFNHWNFNNRVPMTIVHGACRTGGADLWASHLETRLKTPGMSGSPEYSEKISFKEFPANWNRQPDGSYNVLAGFERNEEMVSWVSETIKLSEFQEGPYHTAHGMAFRHHNSKGTTDCLNHIIKAGINYDLFERN